MSTLRLAVVVHSLLAAIVSRTRRGGLIYVNQIDRHREALCFHLMTRSDGLAMDCMSELDAFL